PAHKHENKQNNKCEIEKDKKRPSPGVIHQHTHKAGTNGSSATAPASMLARQGRAGDRDAHASGGGEDTAWLKGFSIEEHQRLHASCLQLLTPPHPPAVAAPADVSTPLLSP
ncbi:unnamed protein product, partial [Ectocarpus fasciculatus]